MKWLLKRRTEPGDSARLALEFEEMATIAEQWQSRLATIAREMEAIDSDEATTLRSASVELCLDLSGVIAGCQVSATRCRAFGKLRTRSFASPGGDVVESRGS